MTGMRETAAPRAEDTRAVGRSLAALVRPGDVIILQGPLGAGKTVFAAGLAEGLGVEERVLSPSFVLVKTYRDGFMPVVHADVYRLGSSAEIEDLDLPGEARDGLLMIEWGDMLGSRLAGDRLEAELSGAGAEPRTIRLFPYGDWRGRDLGLARC